MNTSQTASESLASRLHTPGLTGDGFGGCLHQRMKTYSEKLRDPRWQAMRLRVMDRDRFTCQDCHSKTSTLNVHHAFYRKGADPWDYDPGDLISLCESCHLRAEQRRNVILSNTVRPLTQVAILNFSQSLALVPGPFPRHFEMILLEIHSMMELTEEFFESDDQGEKEDVYQNFKSILMEAQRWMFALMQHLEGEMMKGGGTQPKEPQPTRSLDELIQESPEQ